MPTAPNASIYIYRACVNLYLFLFFPPRGGAKTRLRRVHYGPKNCQPGPWPLIARPCCCCCRSLAMPHAQRLTTSEQRPGRWPTCVDEGRVGHNPARTYGAIAVELRVFPPLIRASLCSTPPLSTLTTQGINGCADLTSRSSMANRGSALAGAMPVLRTGTIYGGKDTCRELSFLACQ